MSGGFRFTAKVFETTNKKNDVSDFFIKGDISDESFNFKFGSKSEKTKKTFKSDSKFFNLKNKKISFPNDFNDLFSKPKKIKQKYTCFVKNGTLVIKYDHKKDINIIDIDKVVLDLIKCLKNENSDNDKKINKLESKLKGQITIIERKYINDEIQKLKKKTLNTNNKKMKYINEVENIIKNYDDISHDDGIVNDYLRIVKKYVNVELIRNKIKSNLCIGCKRELRTIGVCEIVICGFCNCENTFKNKVVNEHDKVNTSVIRKKNEENFICEYQLFNNEKSPKLPENFENKLDEYFKHTKFPVGSEIKKRPLIDNGLKKTRQGTKIDIMIEALQKCKFNKYYRYVRHICVLYWGWVLKDISKYKEQIFARYRITSNIYNKIKLGSSNLNTDFHLFKILRSMELDCRPNDFKAVKGRNTIKNYESHWQKIVNEITGNPNNKYYHYYNGQKIDWKFSF
jgi:hypothetical protein